jgi:ATP-dependent exoDNAse (exonuclease V) alpha subunit
MVWMADTLMTNIIHLVKTDERFSTAKSNILSVDTLIIDEISMISAKVLNQVQVLCKGIRNYDALFGNIQTLLVGDFLQLPPSLMNPMEILTASVS